MGMHHVTMKREKLSLASAMHFGQRAWIASLLSWLATKAFPRDGPYEALASMTWCSFDETPLTFTASDFRGPRRYPDIPKQQQQSGGLIANMQAAPAPMIGRKRNKGESQTCKVVQSDGAVSICLRRKSDQRYVIIELALNMPLQLVDRTTAEALGACVKESMMIPLWQSLRHRFRHSFDSSSTDQASSNLKLTTFKRLRKTFTTPSWELGAEAPRRGGGWGVGAISMAS